MYDTKDPFESTFYCVKSDGNYGIVTGTAEYSRCVLFDTRNQVHHVQVIKHRFALLLHNYDDSY